MPLTANSDIMGRIHESAFNKVLHEIMLQRPSSFNYATERVIRNEKYCTPIAINPILDSMGIAKCTKVPKIPIIGLNNPIEGFDYCIQLKDLSIDLNPSSVIQLPPELGNLALQQFALKGTVCAGLACNTIYRKIPDLADLIKTSKKVKTRKITKGLTFMPFEYLKMNCFCLSLYAKVIMVRDNNHLKLKLVGIELEDIAPLGLENSIECYLKQMLDEVIFPKAKIALEDFVFNVGSYFSIELTPISPDLLFNPDVSNNNLSIFLNIN